MCEIFKPSAFKKAIIIIIKNIDRLKYYIAKKVLTVNDLPKKTYRYYIKNNLLDYSIKTHLIFFLNIKIGLYITSIKKNKYLTRLQDTNEYYNYITDEALGFGKLSLSFIMTL
jgi:hypothetical protein